MKSRIGVGVICLSMFLLGSQPAHAETIDPAFRSDIEKLMEVTGFARTGTQVASLLAGQMLDGLKKSRPDISERVIALAKEVLETEFAKAFTGPDGLSTQFVEIYARHFTHEEITGLLSFYESDLGKKALGATPVLIQEGAVAGQEWAMANMPRITAALESRLRAEGFAKLLPPSDEVVRKHGEN